MRGPKLNWLSTGAVDLFAKKDEPGTESLNSFAQVAHALQGWFQVEDHEPATPECKSETPRLAPLSGLGDDRGVQIITTIAEVRAQPKAQKRVLVPTMGALHQGHLELIRAARNHAARGGEVAVSIFVNPLQFEPGSDFERYPRPESVDEELCRSAGVDLLFRPTVNEMYAEAPSVVVEETALAQTLEGESRKGHFRGVCTVVAKLFNILSPDVAIFGEKDFQQLAIIRRLVRDLNFAIEIVGVPTVREEDGLALSSRNQYLNPEERKAAPVLRAALMEAVALVRGGEKSAARIVTQVEEMIGRAGLARIDYVELVDADNLQPLEVIAPGSLLALAVFFGKTRLIDNIRLP